MRAALILTGAAGIATGAVTAAFLFQRAQIDDLRRQVLAIQQNQPAVSPASAPVSTTENAVPAAGQPAYSRQAERRLILARYRNTIARMNLTPADAARLQNVLTSSVEEVLDAEDAAHRENAEDASKAEATAIGQMDYEIAMFMNTLGPRVPAVPAEPPPAPAPAAPTVVVIQAPAAPAAAPVEMVADDSAATPALPLYADYGWGGVVVGERERRREPAVHETIQKYTTPKGGAWLSIPSATIGAGGGRKAGSR